MAAERARNRQRYFEISRDLLASFPTSRRIGAAQDATRSRSLAG